MEKIAVINASSKLSDPWTVGFYGELHRGIAEEAGRLDLEFDFFDAELSLKTFFSEKRYRAYAGILGLISEAHPEFEWWRRIQEEIPCVNMMTGNASRSENYVGTDEREGMTILGKHLAAEGHRSVGFFAPFGYLHDRPRFEAYLAMLEDRAFPRRQEWVCGFDLESRVPSFTGSLTFSASEKEERVSRYAVAYLSLKKKPDALIFSSDSYAFLFWEAALAAGFRIPQDLAIAGIGDRSHFILPRERRPLSSLNLELETLGTRGLRLLSEIMGGKRKARGQSVLIPPSLRVRRSSLKRSLHRDPREDFRRTVNDYVRQHLGDNRALGRLARFLEVSPSHFSKRFREVMGLPFRTHILGERMARARFLLLETAASIKAIQEEIGYPHHRRFYQKFRAHFGCSPQELRSRGGDTKSQA